MIEMENIDLSRTVRAIVCIGPLTESAGARPGSFFQVEINPAMQSPGGKYIRFDNRAGDEIHGWQRIDALTVCEVLEELDESAETITIRKVKG